MFGGGNNIVKDEWVLVSLLLSCCKRFKKICGGGRWVGENDGRIFFFLVAVIIQVFS
jgi:hypothetical protein